MARRKGRGQGGQGMGGQGACGGTRRFSGEGRGVGLRGTKRQPTRTK